MREERERPGVDDEVYAARAAAGFVSPLRPLAPGKGWCLAAFVGGLYEFLVHPDEAAWCLEHGIRLDGRPLHGVHVVDVFPLMNGVLLRARDDRQEVDVAGFVDASQTEIPAPPGLAPAAALAA